ncbi:MAG TPA: Ada metal-binding domain-containing protein [Bryobacteraceae bacterium]|jgi:AraC family transcriptional regulator of adaptative response / DNA-3-methyladenine glycosylase II|nr:Ada metal-binding domain-containing protein [Bryobacteraceae bacterium]
MDDERRYQHFLKRDPAYDGKFLTGVLTTGIYCLPSCPARRPKRENIRFFSSPDEARQCGLRPCRRCHPDWFYRGEEWYESLYERTVARVREAPASFPDIAAVGAAAGISRTALNELFREHGHESPAVFLRRVRVERVCELLERGVKPADAAASAGFEGSSAFHQQFMARTGLTPGGYTDLRDAREFVLRLPVGYRFREVLDFYGRDPESVGEQVFADGFRKAVTIDGRAALIEISFEKDSAVVHSARVQVDDENAFAAHRAVVRMLGLDSDAAGFERQFAGDPLLGALVHRQRGLRIPLTPEPWEALAWAIVGQQISLKAAVRLRRALIAALGMRHASGLRAHPTAEAVAALDVEALRKLKFSGSKAEYLIAAAKAVARGELPIANLRDRSVRHSARLLGNVRGIGPWTIQYVFLRGFGFADCLPAGDAGLAQGLGRLSGERPEEARVRETMERFAPHRSLATYHVWASLKGDKSDEI